MKPVIHNKRSLLLSLSVAAALAVAAIMAMVATVASAQSTQSSVVSFDLINADTDQVIGPLNDGDILNLATLPTRNLNVRANTSPSTVRRVKFGYDSKASYCMENSAPYALAGNKGSDYRAWTPSVGSHTLTATPWSSKGATGTQGTAMTANFSVTDDPSPPPPPPPPTGGSGSVTGTLKQWHPVTVSFSGPSSSETSSSPNPFLDYRLQVTFTSPSGHTFDVPGFFDGDGNGGATGNVWRAHFSPDEAGTWSYKASFRRGTNIAVDLSPTAGSPTGFDGASGTFEVADRDPAAPGFLKWGRLEYVGKHYLKFRDGPYWIKGGANSPENWLGYSGFDNTPTAKHTFSPHVQDWNTGDPVFNATSADGGKGLIGALNYLSSQGANSIFFLPMNIGGDGKDTSPYVRVASWFGSTSNDNKHFDISKLRQWQAAFAHAQKKGLHLHFVLGEAEEANKKELDGATLGVERKLFYREMVARYGHHLALQWNVSEEYNYNYPLHPDTVKVFAGYIQQQDPYDHPITVHHAGDPAQTWTPFLGDSRFSTTSLQCCRHSADGPFSANVEAWRAKTTSAGRPLPVSLDEFCGLCTTTAGEMRKKILWPIYLSGGQLEWFTPGGDPGEDRTLEDFRLPYEELLTYTLYARSFMEGNLPFWEMAPQDGLLSGESGESTAYGGAQVFAKGGQIYAVYLPDATSTGSLDLSGVSGDFQESWYNPRTGSFEGTTQTISGGGKRSLGAPPSSASSDWVVLIKEP